VTVQPDKTEAILADFKAGMTLGDLMAKHGCDPVELLAVAALAEDRRGETVSIKEVAAEYGVDLSQPVDLDEHQGTH
jgi:hypothetical protein